MSEFLKYAKCKIPSTKEYLLYYYIYMKFYNREIQYIVEKKSEQ